MRLWYLSHRRTAKAQARLRILAVSPEPSLFASLQSRQSLRCSHTQSMEVDEGSDQNQTCSPSGLLRMRVWRLSLPRAISAIISWVGSLYFCLYEYFSSVKSESIFSFIINNDTSFTDFWSEMDEVLRLLLIVLISFIEGTSDLKGFSSFHWNKWIATIVRIRNMARVHFGIKGNRDLKINEI